MSLTKKMIYALIATILVGGIIWAILSTSEYKTVDVTHYKSGKIKSKTLLHKENKNEITRFYYPKGELEKIRRLDKDGNGIDSGYYRSGELLFTCDYQGWEPFGIYTSYFKTGEIETQGLINTYGEEGEWKSFYKNGNLKEHWEFNEGKLVTVIGVFTESGDSLSFGDFKNGNGHVVSYHENGQIKDLTVYKNGLPHNVKNIFSSTGKELAIGSFKNGEGELNNYRDSVLDYTAYFENGRSIDYTYPEENQ